MTLLTIRSIINWLCGLLMIIGLPCLIIWIILAAKNKSKKSKARWIVLICILPWAFVIQFISSIIFHSLVIKEYQNYPDQGIHQIYPSQEIWAIEYQENQIQ